MLISYVMMLYSINYGIIKTTIITRTIIMYLDNVEQSFLESGWVIFSDTRVSREVGHSRFIVQYTLNATSLRK